ncbi:ATP-binding domain-containing protein [Vibrio fluvialis]|nr:ATP-binding domain-containing protein [Vibrio fluvialis]
MSSYCFFTPEAQALVEDAGIKEQIEEFAESNKKQTYVVYRPLSKEDSTYDYDGAVVLFASGTRPCFIDINGDEDAFSDYIDDFIDDVSYLSEKFKYRIKIGRKKYWSSLFFECNFNELDFDKLVITKPSDKRESDLITSLIIGSINDVSKIDLGADNILDIVKSKIILFDTDQTSFVFKTGNSKKYVIQGLAGSGKTELLLHKLKEIYSNDAESRIAFTCFNKILASSMKNRIPDFFDFMRVEKQIDWNNKLFCFHAWGSSRLPYSGMYRYICHAYNISFGTFQSGTFDYLCKRAIEDIKKLSSKEGHHYIFDYVFIDESQDFPDSFIDLCELVTEKKVFVAGDVFQNIFRPIDVSVARSDLVLKKCYRTDPRNLMFSHALGMGLYENPVLRWLKPHEWEACGYNYKESNGRAVVNRDPLRRFEDIPEDFNSTAIHQVDNKDTISESVFRVIENIKERHSSISQGDIAVLFIDKSNYIYDVIAELKNMISTRLGWEVNVSFETKTSDPNKFFISNINNAKGLEFPFVICFAMDLNRNPSFRNGLYTMMARSFLESHLVLGNPQDKALLKTLTTGLECMNTSGNMDLRIPTEDEIADQDDLIIWDDKPSIEDYIRQFCIEKKATPRLVAKLISRISSIIGDEDFDQNYIDSLLEIEYERNLSL